MYTSLKDLFSEDEGQGQLLTLLAVNNIEPKLLEGGYLGLLRSLFE
jgi:hypothetical protein